MKIFLQLLLAFLVLGLALEAGFLGHEGEVRSTGRGGSVRGLEVIFLGDSTASVYPDFLAESLKKEGVRIQPRKLLNPHIQRQAEKLSAFLEQEKPALALLMLPAAQSLEETDAAGSWRATLPAIFAQRFEAWEGSYAHFRDRLKVKLGRAFSSPACLGTGNLAFLMESAQELLTRNNPLPEISEAVNKLDDLLGSCPGDPRLYPYLAIAREAQQNRQPSADFFLEQALASLGAEHPAYRVALAFHTMPRSSTAAFALLQSGPELRENPAALILENRILRADSADEAVLLQPLLENRFNYWQKNRRAERSPYLRANAWQLERETPGEFVMSAFGTPYLTASLPPYELPSLSNPALRRLWDMKEILEDPAAALEEFARLHGLYPRSERYAHQLALSESILYSGGLAGTRKVSPLLGPERNLGGGGFSNPVCLMFRKMLRQLDSRSVPWIAMQNPVSEFRSVKQCAGNENSFRLFDARRQLLSRGKSAAELFGADGTHLTEEGSRLLGEELATWLGRNYF